MIGLLISLWNLAHAGWNYTQPERARFMTWLGRQSRPMRRRVRRIESTLKWTARALLAWPVIETLASMLCPPHLAHTVVPLLTLLLIFPIIWILTSTKLILTFGLVAIIPTDAPFKIGKVVNGMKKTAKMLGVVLLGELAAGVVLSLVPLNNDPGLVPLFVLASIAFVLAILLLAKGWPRTILILIWIGIVATFFLGGREKASVKISEAHASLMVINAYSPKPANALKMDKIICDDAWQNDTQEPPGDHFSVTLHEACFGGLHYLPPRWQDWHYQPVGNDPDWWVAFWPQGDPQPRGPYNRFAKPEFTYTPMRFRGKEGARILIYTMTAAAKAIQVEKPRPEIESPKPSAMTAPATSSASLNAWDIKTSKEATCPDDAKKALYIGVPTVNFTIGIDGRPRDVVINISSGIADLDKNIIDAISKWEFKPANPNAAPAETRVTNFEVLMICSK
jgi:TonB family protein